MEIVTVAQLVKCKCLTNHAEKVFPTSPEKKCKDILVSVLPPLHWFVGRMQSSTGVTPTNPINDEGQF